MKNLYILIVLLFIAVPIYAQTDGLSYQAVILNPNTQELPGVDATGNIYPNKNIAIRFTIANDNGTTDYQETQATTTDSFGMINLFIGEGTPSSDRNFNEIIWDGTPKNLQVDIDFNGGANYISLGNQKLTFVPYAYHRDIFATGDLIVDGITTFNNDLTIEGQMTLNNDLTVTGNTTFDGNTNITGTLDVEDETTLNDDLTVEGLTNLNSDLNVNNASPSNFSGTINVDGISTLNDQLIVQGEASVNNNMSISGNTSVGGNMDIVGATTINGDISVNGNTNLNNSLNVTNGSPTNLSGTLLVEGLTTFNNGLVIEGETIINDDLTVTGNTLIEGNSEVMGNSSVGENFIVGGITNLQDVLKVDNNSASFLTGTLNVDGQTDINNAFNVNSESPVNLSGIVNINGVTTLKDNFNVTNEAESNLSGILKVNGATFMGSTLKVEGITDVNNTFNVNEENISNLSGILNVEGISNLNNDLNVVGTTNLNSELNVLGITTLNDNLTVVGNTRLEDELYVVNNATFADSLQVVGNTLLANLVVKGGNDIGGGADTNHIALFENTNPNNGNYADGIAIRIQGNASNKIGFRNRFVTFYGDGDYVAGRIESYDLLAGDFWESFPIPDFENLINLVDFNSIELEGGELPSLTGGSLPNLTGGTSPSLTGGWLPYMSGGSRPSLSINFSEFSFNFNRGSFPSLHRGEFPTLNTGEFPNLYAGEFPDLFIGEFPTLNLDGFWNPNAATGAADDIGAMVGWGMRHGNPGFLPTSPWKIALTPLILAAKQVAMDQGVIYGSKGADYAEWLEKENVEDTFMFGEVVGVKGGKISRNTTDADQVMSISLAPIVLGNMPDEDRKEDFEKVGFMGQVPVLTLGDVEVGDFIVASGYNDGYAKAMSKDEIKLKDLKNIIGRAWTGSEGQKASIINVSVGLKTNEWVAIFEQQEAKLNDLESKINKLESLSERLENLETKIETLEIN